MALVTASRAAPSWRTGFARSAGESAHPELWRGLVRAWPLHLGPAPRLRAYDMMTKHASGLENGAEWEFRDGTWSLKGGSARLVGIYTAREHIVATNTSVSIGFRCRVTDLALNDGVICASAGGGQADDRVRFTTGGGLQIRIADSNSEITGIGMTSGTWADFLLYRQTTDVWRLYKDGQRVTGTRGNGGTDFRITYLGGDNNGNHLNGNLSYFYVWDRALSNAEAELLHRDQFALVRPKPRRFYTEDAGGGGGGATIPIFHRHYQGLRVA